MKHVVLGLGNLGFDLMRTIHQAGDDGECLSRNSRFPLRFNYPEDGIDVIAEHRPDVVWCTVGAGSVAQAKENFWPFIQSHVELPLKLISHLPKSTRIVLFSTDYVADEKNPKEHACTGKPRSLYAFSKLWMEQMVVALDPVNVRIVRVGSLYGSFKPQACFPGKVLANRPTALPTNFVTPTGTFWLSEFLLNNLDALFLRKYIVQHVAPKGNIRMCDWGREILGSEIEEKDLDIERPAISELGCSINVDVPHWRSVWLDQRNIFKKHAGDALN